MNDVKDILRRALPERTPATRITSADMIRGGRRRYRRRQAAIGVTGAAVVASLAWGSVAVLAQSAPNGGASPLQPGGSVTTRTTTTAPPSAGPGTGPPGTKTKATQAPWTPPTRTSFPPLTQRMPGLRLPPTDPADPTEPAATANARLSAELRREFREILPDARFERVPDATDRTLDSFEVIGSQGGKKAWARITDRLGTGSVFLDIFKAGPMDPAVCYQPQNPPLSCELSVGPGGEFILIERGQQTGSPVTTYLITVVKRDGTAMNATVRNSLKNGGVARPTPPVTPEQVVQILLSPGMTLYP